MADGGTDAVPAPAADGVCDGGDLDCGSGLLLIIRDAMRRVPPRGVLEVRSREVSVREDLPAWCRMVGHGIDAVRPGDGGSTSWFLRKAGARDESLDADLATARGFSWSVRTRWTGGMEGRAFARNHAVPVGQPASLDTADPAPSAVELLLASLGGCLAVGFQWRASRRGIAVRNVEVSLRAKSSNLLVFLAVEDEGTPALEAIEGTAWVDADGDEDALRALWEETVRRSPVARTLMDGTAVRIGMKVP